jgi:hypothetical protein
MDLVARGTTAPSSIGIPAATLVLNAQPIPGDQGLLLPANPILGSQVRVNNNGLVPLLVSPDRPFITIDLNPPGSSVSIAPGFSLIFQAAPGQPYKWVSIIALT